MRKVLSVLAIFTFVAQISNAQLGVIVHYHQGSFETWKDVLFDAGYNDNEIFRQSYKPNP